MDRIRRNPFKQYIEDCELLLRYIEGIINDYQFQSQGKGTIYYAIDASEIYSYVFPQENLNNMKIFRDEDDAITRLTQNHVMESLFFSELKNLTILKPHLIELASLVNRM